jgi:rhamnose transport system permease protein
MSAQAAPAGGPAPAESERARRLTEWVFRVRELGIVVALALLIAVTAILEPRFIETDSLRNLALNASIFAILATGQTLVLVTRNVDLSVGSVLTCCPATGACRCRSSSCSESRSARRAGCSTGSS